jgi:4-hydroxybenzoate polyprenyltransferase
MVAASAVVPEPARFLQIAASAALFYTGGMFLNDAFDADVDARVRPERPLPAADVTRREVFAVGGTLLATGVLLLPRDRTTLLLGLALAAAIVLYDYRHKGHTFAPVVMGLCRGLVYCIAGAAVGVVSTPVLVGALVMTSYVTALTVVAKLAGANARWLVPLLIAGISLVDALVITAVSSLYGAALLAALGFPLTLLLQRVVPGD